MKMIGMSRRSAPICACRSRPLRPGSRISTTRQLGEAGRGRARNSLAEAKVSERQPAESISDSRDSRTEASSSTTNTIGVPYEARAELGAGWSRLAILGDDGLARDMVVSPFMPPPAAAEARVFFVWNELRKLALGSISAEICSPSDQRGAITAFH